MAKAKAKKEVKAKGSRSRAAFVLMVISVILLFINGSLMILARKGLASIFAELGYTISMSFFITYGIIWLALGILMWITTLRIGKKAVKSEEWLLLALSIVTMMAGRLESGILALIAAIIYLVKK